MFATELPYNDLLPTINNPGDEQYNGNIAAIKWNTPEFGMKAYGYGYDEINRLERAKFAAGSALNTDVDKYSVDYSYDANGNILTLGRHNTAAGYIDNLTMMYDGNQLKTADDSGDLALGFYDGTDAEIEYHYDLNGNMDVDDNKGFTFAYNYLNLPKEIVGGNDTVRYIYDANGAKLSKELVQGGAVSYTDYVGNFVYKDGDLDYISTSEGRITEPTAGTIQYEYFLKDHLGNTRTVFADGNGDGILADNEVLQETHYYPFGMSIGDLAIDRGADNKLKYNGKELQDDVLNGVKLNYYAYGWRDYDPIVPHFNRIDRFAEKYNEYSPYQYATNNPILFIDKNGDEPIDPRTGSPVKLNLYRAAVHDLDYINSTNNRIVVDRDLLASASPFMPRTRNKPDGLWEGAAYNKHQSVWQHTSKGASSALKKIFANNPDPSCDFGSPNDNTWKQAARTGTYTFLNDRYAEGEVFQKNLKSFSIFTVEENYITQEVNLTRSSGSGEYNINSVTTFDIEKGEVQTKEVDTWWGGTKTLKYRTLTVTETTTQYENNEATDNQTTKTYTTEERIK